MLEGFEILYLLHNSARKAPRLGFKGQPLDTHALDGLRKSQVLVYDLNRHG